ncbi:MAG: ribosome maturation factor RimM [Bacteroidota bacterium]|jgi:16S rRNA processing protein RimM
MAAYLKLGKILSAHGLTGELLLEHTLGKASSLKKVEVLFIEDYKKALLPYFVTSSRKKTADAVFISLEGINTRERAQQLVSRAVWIPEELYHQLASKNAPANLLGYQIVENDKEIGLITEVIEQPQQLVCKVFIQEQEVLIPLHEDTLLSIDHAAKKVIVQLPDGLLDIYLS